MCCRFFGYKVRDVKTDADTGDLQKHLQNCKRSSQTKTLQLSKKKGEWIVDNAEDMRKNIENF